MVHPSEPEEMLPGVWRAIVEMSARPYRITTNAYLLTGEGESIIVDTGWWNDVRPDHLDSLKEVAQTGGNPVGGVFVTHAHRDHSGFVDHLVAQDPGLKVYLHEKEKPTVAAMYNFQGLGTRQEAIDWYCAFGFPRDKATTIVDTKMPDYPLQVEDVHWSRDEDVINVGGREARVVGTPGHTPGHASVYEERTGILFSGDALLPKGSGNPHVTVRPFTSADPLTDYVNGLTALKERDIRVCLPGHGPIVEEPYDLIDSALGYVDQKMAPVKDVLGDEPLTAFDIASRIPWRGGRKRFEELVNDEWFLAFGDTLARVRRAVTLGWATQDSLDDGIPTFRKGEQ